MAQMLPSEVHFHLTKRQEFVTGQQKCRLDYILNEAMITPAISL